MPYGTNLGGDQKPGFHADRQATPKDAFVARFQPMPPTPKGARGPGPKIPSQPGFASTPASPAATQVAADLRGGQPRPRAAAADVPTDRLTPLDDRTTSNLAHQPAEDAPPPPLLPLAPEPSVQPDDLPERLAKARQEGREQGRAEERAALAGERGAVASAVQALSAAMLRLENPPAEQIARLAKALDAAVTQLAAERAGMAIDQAPSAFAARLARLADRIAHQPGGLTVRLHPADLQAIRSLMAAPDNADVAVFCDARLVADPTLARGDADLMTADIRIADLALQGGMDGSAETP